MFAQLVVQRIPVLHEVVPGHHAADARADQRDKAGHRRRVQLLLLVRASPHTPGAQGSRPGVRVSPRTGARSAAVRKGGE